MKTTINIIAILFLVASIGFAGEIITLKQLDTAEDIARFIHQESQKKEKQNRFIQRLDDTSSIWVSNSDIAIPVREIYAVIIEEMIGGYSWIKENRKVREICSFTDSKGQFHRYHIIQFTSDDYKRIKTAAVKKQTD